MGLHWDGTITLGNVLTFILLTIAIIGFWSARLKAAEAEAAYKRDIEWRIGNLERWRGEHMIDSDARDKLIENLGTIVKHLEWLRKERERDNEGRRRPREGQY